MNIRLILIGFAAAVSLPAQYTYDFTQSPVTADSAHWQVNGAESFQSFGVSFNGSAGSMIYTPAISGTKPNDYEMNTTWSIKSGGGTYVLYSRATSSTIDGCTGSVSYLSLEFSVPTNISGSGPWLVPANFYWCDAGQLFQEQSNPISISDGISLRLVVYDFSNYYGECDTNFWLFSGNTALWNNWFQNSCPNPSGTGNPGIGGYQIPSGSGFAGVKIGHRTTAPPGQINQQSIASSILPNSISARWQGVLDDPNGPGVAHYVLIQNPGCGQACYYPYTAAPELAFDSVQPSTTYQWTIAAMDFHGNYSTPTPLTFTTPPANAVDPRRVGVQAIGSYWGGGGEQIDMLSGNVNFSLPLVSPQLRSGAAIPVSLAYNSQNWRQDSGTNWKLGDDTGYGFGWKVQIGSLTPYYGDWWKGVDHYVFTDASGAEYRLGVNNNNGVWRATQGVYVWFDSNTNRLHFRDGTFWVMGSTSGGTEQDAGTMYPTIVEDVSGNQVLVSYDAGAGLPSTAVNTSGRIVTIEDVRATGCPSNPTPNVVNCATYTFSYTRDSYGTRLTGISNTIGTSEAWTFNYATNQPLGPPFGYDSTFAGLTTNHLASVSTPAANPFSLSYDSAGAGELTQLTFPFGGHLRWNYFNDLYSGSRYLRAVNMRYLAADSAGATEWTYPITWDNASSAIVHGTTTLADASGNGSKTWNFINSSASPAWQMGLVSEFLQKPGPSSSAIYTDASYTWSQDAAANPYVSSKTSIIDEGTANQQSALTTQTLDGYGNVTQSVVYPYNNTSTPLQTYNNTYLNSYAYSSNYIFNRLLTTTLTTGGTNKTLAQNYYDGVAGSGQPAYPCGGSWAPVTPSGYSTSNATDPSPPIAFANRGLPSATVNPATTTCNSDYIYGAVSSASRSDGATMAVNASSATNFAAPQSITTQSYSQSVVYNAFLGITQTTGLNGEQMAMTYDWLGRPLTATSPFGTSGTPTVTYSYSAQGVTPVWQQMTGPNGVTITTLDGLGRPIRVLRGDSAAVDATTSYTDTVYASNAGSPLGSIQEVSQPYAPGSPTITWTASTYDGTGRTVSVQQPDGASTATYSYSGNQTTVTDPAGKWKQYTTDVLGNLTTVLEPDPANPPSGTLTTAYTYDWMNHVSQVTMTRGSTTQTRTFVYSDAGLLTSATNLENGTAAYTYNADNTLSYKHDAKGQDTVYSYDTQKRVTKVQYYPTGKNNTEDQCQRVTYSYDTNPYNSSFSQNSMSRLTAAAYGPVNASGQSCIPGVAPTTYMEMYSYHPAGAVTAKEVQATRNSIASNLNVNYTYDSAGRRSSVAYPMAVPFGAGSYPGGATTFTYTLDAMGRPVSMADNHGWTWAQNVQYDYAGRPTSLQYLAGAGVFTTQSMGYNANSQLTSLNWTTASGYGPTGGIQYTYSGTQNNGEITQAVDTISGETIVYQYDMLRRLTSAASTPNGGSTPAAWTQTFPYDGFGNLTGRVLNGTSTPIAVNPATNQLSNAYYDANGNMTSGVGATIVYDEANRMFSAAEVSGGTEYYAYAPDNRRIYRLEADGVTEEWTFFGASGERLGVYSLNSGGFSPLRSPVSFAGKLILDSNNALFADRLGTNRASGARFYPFGDEISSTSNDREKFATYTRDSYTGLDYADQRFYASTYGRFNTPDRKQGSAHISNPGSWNRYAYALGDPVNGNDPSGLDTTDVCSDDGDNGDCGAGGVVLDNDNWWEGAENDPVTASVTTTGCSAPGEAYSGGPNGSCDQPIGGPYVAGLQQVGNNANGIYTLVGGVAGGSALIGAAGGIAAGYLASSLTTLGLGGAAAAGAAATPQGQEAGETIVDVGTTVYRVFGGTSPQFGPSWTTVDPTTVVNYPNAAGLPPGNTAQWMVTGSLNDLTDVTTTTATRIGNNLGGLPEVNITNSACQVTVVCVSPFRGRP